MAQYISLLHLDDGAVEEMEVAAADGRASDFQDDIAVFYDRRLGRFNLRVLASLCVEECCILCSGEMCIKLLTNFDLILAHPSQSLHLLS